MRRRIELTPDGKYESQAERQLFDKIDAEVRAFVKHLYGEVCPDINIFDLEYYVGKVMGYHVALFQMDELKVGAAKRRSSVAESPEFIRRGTHYGNKD